MIRRVFLIALAALCLSPVALAETVLSFDGRLSRAGEGRDGEASLSGQRLARASRSTSPFVYLSRGEIAPERGGTRAEVHLRDRQSLLHWGAASEHGQVAEAQPQDSGCPAWQQ